MSDVYGLPTLSGLTLARAVVPRAGEQRTDPAWFEKAWADPASKVIVVGAAQALVRTDEAGVRLELHEPAAALAIGELAIGELAIGELAGAAAERILLGTDEFGTVFLGLLLPNTPTNADGVEALDLRQVGALLDDRDAGLLVHAVALWHWHTTHQFCPRCGSRTRTSNGGHVRTCELDGSEHYPRSDPAVIVLVESADGRCLLGRQKRWPPKRYSCFAGFVEPGESAEQALARELGEEAGITISAFAYRGSQPWPFPRSLMLGYRALAASTDARPDGHEIEELGWYSREELSAAIAAGDVLLPPGVSIARRLVEDWFGAELPDGPSW